MAFFGYDPMQGRGEIGRAVASAGQQLGGALQRLPQQQQALQLGQQQQEINGLQIQKMKDVEKQLQANPRMVSELGASVSELLWDELEGLSEDLQLKLSPRIEQFQSNMKRYGNSKRLTNQESQSAIAEMQSTYKIIENELRLERGLEAGAGAETQRELLGQASEGDRSIPAKPLLATAFGASLPGTPKLVDPKDAIALERAKIGLASDKVKFAGLGKGKPLSASDMLAEKRFQTITELKVTENIGKIKTKVAEIRSEIVKDEAIVEAFIEFQKIGDEDFDPKTGKFSIPTFTNEDGEPITVTKEMSDKALKRLENHNKTIKDLVKRQNRQEKILQKAQKKSGNVPSKAGDILSEGIADTSITGDATKVGDYVGGWTTTPIKISKNRIRGLELTKKYDPIIKEASEKYGVPEDIIRSVMVQESYLWDEEKQLGFFNPKARSKANAGGLMQIVPKTAKELGVTDVDDPRQSIMGGTKYLAQQLKRFGNIEAALSGYNAGPGHTSNWREKGSNYSKKKPETKKYVSMIQGYLKYLAGLKGPEAAEAPIGDEAVATASGLNQITQGDVTPTADPATGNALQKAAPDFPAAPAVVTSETNQRRRGDVENKFRQSWAAALKVTNKAERKDRMTQILNKIEENKAAYPSLYEEIVNDLTRFNRRKMGLE